MALTFPNSPSSGQFHTAENGLQYRYDGAKWTTVGSDNATAGLYVGDKVSLLTNDAGYITSATLPTASQTLTSIKTVDGTGSGLDADLLDGQEGSHYLNYNNLDNKPTIPTNNNQLTNGAGYITSAGVGNGTITINQAGSSKGTFTVNQAGNTTINLDGNTGGAGSYAISPTRSTVSTSGNTWYDFPGLSANITSSSGKVMIVATVYVASSDNLGFRLTRNGSPIAVGTADGSRMPTTGSCWRGDSISPGTCTLVYIDNPGTGNNNYKVQYYNHRNGGSSGGTIYLNQASNTGNDNADQPICCSAIALCGVS